jgi:hypothetical protein
MFAVRKSALSTPAPAGAGQDRIDWDVLSAETGVSVEVLRALAEISDPANGHRFTAAAAREAFSGVTVRPAQV